MRLLDGVHRWLNETFRVVLLAEKHIADCLELLTREPTVGCALSHSGRAALEWRSTEMNRGGSSTVTSIDERVTYGDLPFLPHATSPMDRATTSKPPLRESGPRTAVDTLGPMVRAPLLPRYQIPRNERR